MESSASITCTSQGFPKYTPDFDWRFYKSLVDNYFALNGVKDDNRQKELFFTYLPMELICLVFTLARVEELATATMPQIFEKLSLHFEKELPVSFHRRSFFKRERGEKENIAEYATALKLLVKRCYYGNETNTHLCNCFLLGLNQERLQNVLSTDRECEDFEALVQRAIILNHTFGAGVRGGDMVGVNFTDGGDIGSVADVRGVGRNENGVHIVKIEQTEGTTACDLKHMGCNFVGSIPELERHNVAFSSKHVMMANSFFDQYTKTLGGTILSLQNEVNAYKQQIDKRFDDQLNAARAEHCIATQDASGVPESALVWCVSGVAKHIKAAQESTAYRVSSDQFYTSQNGYHMSAYMKLVDGVTKPEPVGIYVCLQPGDHDSTLPWPFTQKVTVTMQEQTWGIAKNITKCFLADPNNWMGCQNPPKKINYCGWGFASYVTLDLLQKHYVKDDKLFLTITVGDD